VPGEPHQNQSSQHQEQRPSDGTHPAPARAPRGRRRVRVCGRPHLAVLRLLPSLAHRLLGCRLAAGDLNGDRLNEPVPLPGHCLDEAVIALLLPESSPDLANGLDEAVLGDSRVTPHRIEELLLVDQLSRALDAGVDEVNVVVAASDGFATRNQNAPVAELLDAAQEIAAEARAAGLGTSVVVSTAFGCPFDGEVPADRVLDVVRRCLDAGFDELAVADTIGVGVPAQVRDLMGGIRAMAGTTPDGAPVRLRAHFHNTRNTGYANALAAVEAGVEVLDASAGGIGGCPFAPAATGNIATEDLLYLLRRSGFPTGVDLGAIAAAGTWVCGELGKDVPALLGRAGDFPPPALLR